MQRRLRCQQDPARLSLVVKRYARDSDRLARKGQQLLQSLPLLPEGEVARPRASCRLSVHPTTLRIAGHASDKEHSLRQLCNEGPRRCHTWHLRQLPLHSQTALLIDGWCMLPSEQRVKHRAVHELLKECVYHAEWLR